MFRLQRFAKDLIYFFIIFLLIFSYSFDEQRSSSSSITFQNEERQENVQSIDYSILCSDLNDIIDYEKSLSLPLLIESPSINSSIRPRLLSYYHLWKSSSILPRSLSPCEHHLLMKLLKLIDEICRKNEIIYFMFDGTFLGSIRHQNVIPWDDDIDLLIPYEQKKRFFRSFQNLNQTLFQLQLLKGEKKRENYYKFYFLSSPSAGEFSWRFPFIDIFFYRQNKSHLWNLRHPEMKYSVDEIFPLLMRPLGSMWIPSPKYAKKLFSFDLFDQCQGHFWNHRNESEQNEISISCRELNRFYPFVRTINENNQFTEHLVLNQTILQTIIFH